MEDYGIIDLERAKAHKPLKEGYNYMSMCIVNTEYNHIKSLLVDAHVYEEYMGPLPEDNYLVYSIDFTNKHRSFEETEKFILDNQKYLYDLAQQGAKGIKLIEMILNNNECVESVSAELLKEDIKTIAIKESYLKDDSKLNYISILYVNYREKQSLHISRIRKPEDRKNGETNRKLICEYGIKKVDGLEVNLKKIAEDNITRIFEIIENNDCESTIYEQIEGLVANSI